MINTFFPYLQVTNSASFAQIKVQISEMENYCDETIPKILVGNKDDNNNEINKVISTRDVCEYAEQNHLTFFETSVKDNKNITEVFNEIARLTLERCLGNSLNKVSGIRIEKKPNKRKCYKQEVLYRIKYKI
jgi:GTPase SAR1 family protein